MGEILRKEERYYDRVALARLYELPPQEGNILMDAPFSESFDKLVNLAADRQDWDDFVETIS